MNALPQAIAEMLREMPMQFTEIVDAHRGVAWRDFLSAWGALRTADILRRDEIGRYYIAGGPAEDIAGATRAE